MKGTPLRPARSLIASARGIFPILVYSAATLCFTWPLSRLATDHVFRGTEPFSASLRADMLLVTWILRWDVHALTSDAANLFNANALHPAPNVLALSEHLLGNVPLYGLFFGLSGNPILAFNSWVFSSFVLAGCFMHLLVRRWTDSSVAAYVAGLAFAFAPWRIPDGIGRPHLLQLQYLPLILLALDRTAANGRLRTALPTAALIALQTLCSYYLGYQAFVIVGGFLTARVFVCGVRGQGRQWTTLTLAVLLAALLILPFTLPYLAMRTDGGLSFEWTQAAKDFLMLAGLDSWRFVAGHYVGWGTLALGIVAVPEIYRSWAGGRRETAARRLGCLIVAAMGFVLARGPLPLLGDWLNPYEWLVVSVPGFANLRVPLRFGSVASFGTSVLAGFAVASAVRWGARLRPARAARLVISCLSLASVLYHPIVGTPRLDGWPVPVGRSIPPVYRWLARHGDGKPLLELPFAEGLGRQQAEAQAMYFSTYHWLPLLNGHTGYLPTSYRFLKQYGEQLPSRGALQMLVDCSDLRWILVRAATRPRLEAWNALPGVRLRGMFQRPSGGWDRLYEVTATARSECKGALFDSAVTCEGRPAIPPPTLHGSIAVAGLRRFVFAGVEQSVNVTVTNTSSMWWPCTATEAGRRVVLRAAWEDAAGRVGRLPQDILLARDVGPGERLETSVWLRAPSAAGNYRVRIWIASGRDDDAATEDTLSWQEQIRVLVRPPAKRAARYPRQGSNRPGAGEGS